MSSFIQVAAYPLEWYTSVEMRQIDQQRIQAQIALANRITRGGEIDLEQAIKERLLLADRIDARRTYFIAWMKKRGWPQLIIDGEVKEMEELIVELRTPPFSQRALGGLGGMLG